MSNEAEPLSQEHWFKDENKQLAKQHFKGEFSFYIEQVEIDDTTLVLKHYAKHPIRHYGSDAVITYSNFNLDRCRTTLANFIVELEYLLHELFKSEEMINYNPNENTEMFRKTAKDFLDFLKK